MISARMSTSPVFGSSSASRTDSPAARPFPIRPAEPIAARQRKSPLSKQRFGSASRAPLHFPSASAASVDNPWSGHESWTQASLEWKEGDPSNFTLGILGDLHIDPRDLTHSYEGREHMKRILKRSANPFLVSLGDLGESKDCTESKQLYAGTSECFRVVREFLDGFETK